MRDNEEDLRLLRHSIEIARRSRENGNHPFGAILVDGKGEILLEAENTVVTERDISAHSELNLIRKASRLYESEFMVQCTLYSSTEPCPMCAGAIFWGNIRRVVFGLSEEGLYDLIGEGGKEVLKLPCREVFAAGQKKIEVIGPLLEDEARIVHLGFWD